MDPSDYSSTSQALAYGLTDLYPLSGLAPFIVVLIVVSTLSIVLRCWARGVSAGPFFGWDDWFAIVSLPLSLITQIIVLILLNNGLGKHVRDLKPSQASYIFLNFYWGQLVWILGTSCIRFSALAFYARIFHPRSNPSLYWKLFYWIVVGLTIIWTAFFLLYDGAFQCDPINAFWDLTLAPTKCVSVYTSFLIGSVGILIVDILILLVPIPQVLKLRIQLRKRIAISISFALGYGVAFMSIGRIIMSLQIGNAIQDDPTFFLIPYLYWDMAEIALSILAICLPAIFQLSRRTKRAGFRSLFHKRRNYTRTDGSARHEGGIGHRLLGLGGRTAEPSWDNVYDGNVFSTIITAGPAPPTNFRMNSGRSDNEITLSGINVRHEIQLEHTHAI